MNCIIRLGIVFTIIVLGLDHIYISSTATAFPSPVKSNLFRNSKIPPGQRSRDPDPEISFPAAVVAADHCSTTKRPKVTEQIQCWYEIASSAAGTGTGAGRGPCSRRLFDGNCTKGQAWFTQWKSANKNENQLSALRRFTRVTETEFKYSSVRNSQISLDPSTFEAKHIIVLKAGQDGRRSFNSSINSIQSIANTLQEQMCKIPGQLKMSDRPENTVVLMDQLEYKQFHLELDRKSKSFMKNSQHYCFEEKIITDYITKSVFDPRRQAWAKGEFSNSPKTRNQLGLTKLKGKSTVAEDYSIEALRAKTLLTFKRIAINRQNNHFNVVKAKEDTVLDAVVFMDLASNPMMMSSSSSSRIRKDVGGLLRSQDPDLSVRPVQFKLHLQGIRKLHSVKKVEYEDIEGIGNKTVQPCSISCRNVNRRKGFSQ